MNSYATPRGIDPGNIDPGNIDYLHHLAHDSERFVKVLRQTPAEKRVPACPDWDADDLLWHLAEVQWFWATIVGRGLTMQADVDALVRDPRPADREGLLELFARGSGDLLRNLSSASAQTPAWTWADQQTVGFIRRRQAHEALIHRVDAELTAGDRSPMDRDLSSDGVDEVLRVMYGAVPPWGRFTPDPAQTIRVRTSDTARSWLITLGQFTGADDDGTAHNGPDLGVSESDIGGPTAATITGAAADLDCWLWHRPPAGQIERAGDAMVLDRLEETIAPGIT